MNLGPHACWTVLLPFLPPKPIWRLLDSPATLPPPKPIWCLLGSPATLPPPKLIWCLLPNLQHHPAPQSQLHRTHASLSLRDILLQRAARRRNKGAEYLERPSLAREPSCDPKPTVTAMKAEVCLSSGLVGHTEEEKGCVGFLSQCHSISPDMM